MPANSVLGVPMLRRPEGSELYRQVPQLSGFLSGLGGTAPDELAGSVLDPLRAKAQEGAKYGFGIGTALNIVPMLGGLSGMKASTAVPRLGSNQAGAIRIGGNPDNMLTHAFNPTRAGAIVESGKLISPSLGITNARPNGYSPDSPQFVFKAGATDVKPLGGTLLNRDGYFSNPTGLRDGPNGKVYDINKHAEDILKADDEMHDTFGAKDWRLGQDMPSPGQALSIMASPSFKSFAEFEAHPQGQGALAKFVDSAGDKQPEWQKLSYMAERMGIKKPEARDMFRAVNTGHTPDKWPELQQKLWNRAADSPSEMAELKLRENLPVNPENAFIHVPSINANNPGMLRELIPLRDKGFQFVHEGELGADADKFGNLARIAAPDGTFQYPPKLAPAPGTPWHDFTSGLDPMEEHIKRMGGTYPIPPTKVPVFKDLDHADAWMMDNGDEVLSVAQDALGSHPNHAALMSDANKTSFLQHAANTAHGPGFFNEANWHGLLDDKLDWWLKENFPLANPIKLDTSKLPSFP
jgi:hypothetical protein